MGTLDLTFAFRDSRWHRTSNSLQWHRSLVSCCFNDEIRQTNFFHKQVCAQPALDMRLKIVPQSPCFRAHWPRYRPNDAMNVNHLQHQALPAAEAGPTTLIL